MNKLEDANKDKIVLKAVPRSEVSIIPEATDDFVRNFLVKLNLLKTLNCFQNEWFELLQSGKIKPEDAGNVPDLYVKNQQLNDRVKFLQLEVDRFKSAAELVNQYQVNAFFIFILTSI